MFSLAKLQETGYYTAPAGTVSYEFIVKNDLLAIRGIIVDGIFLNDKRGRAALKAWDEKAKRRKKK